MQSHTARDRAPRPPTPRAALRDACRVVALAYIPAFHIPGQRSVAEGGGRNGIVVRAPELGSMSGRRRRQVLTASQGICALCASLVMDQATAIRRLSYVRACIV